MRKLLKDLISSEGRKVLLNPEMIDQRLQCSKENEIIKRQFMLILAVLKPNDLEILCGNDVIQKSNIMRRCIICTGLSADVCGKCFSDLFYALGCDHYVPEKFWLYRATDKNEANDIEYIITYEEVKDMIKRAEKADEQEAILLWDFLAKAGVPCARTEIALKQLASENLNEDGKKNCNGDVGKGGK